MASRKRKAESSASKEEESSSSRSPDEVPKDSTKASTRGKRVKAPARKEPEEPEYLPDRRNLVLAHFILSGDSGVFNSLLGFDHHSISAHSVLFLVIWPIIWLVSRVLKNLRRIISKCHAGGSTSVVFSV